MKKMYVGNIAFNATEEDLRDLFSEYGEIESLKIIQDQDTGRSKGFGFIEMAEEKDTRKAIEELNGKDFMEKTLKVSEAKPQQKRSGFNRGGGGYGGGYGGGGSRGSGRGWR